MNATDVINNSLLKDVNFRRYDDPVSFEVSIYGVKLKVKVIGQIVNPHLPFFVLQFDNGAIKGFYPEKTEFGWATHTDDKDRDIYAEAVCDELGALLFEGGLDVQYSQVIPDNAPPAPIEKYIPKDYKLQPTEFLFRKQIGGVVHEVWATAIKDILDRTFYIAIVANSAGLFKELFMSDAGNWLATEEVTGETEYVGGGYIEELGKLIEEHYL